MINSISIILLDEILESNNIDRNVAYLEVEKAGWNIESECKKLEKFYMNIIGLK